MHRSLTSAHRGAHGWKCADSFIFGQVKADRYVPDDESLQELQKETIEFVSKQYKDEPGSKVQETVEVVSTRLKRTETAATKPTGPAEPPVSGSGV